MKEKNMFTPIDEEERDLINSLEKGEWKEIEENEEYKLQAKKYAEATMKKDKRMNIRISERDLKNLKIRAKPLNGVAELKGSRNSMPAIS